MRYLFALFTAMLLPGFLPVLASDMPPAQMVAMAPEEKLADLLWSLVSPSLIWVVGVICLCWIISVAGTHLLKGSVPDTPAWTVKVRGIAFAIGFLFCAILMPLALDGHSTLYAKVVLIFTIAFFCGVTSPLIFDPVLKRFLWPLILRPALGMVFDRFKGQAPAA